MYNAKRFAIVFLFACALAQKALQLPGFSEFFSTVFLDGLTKFFLLKSLPDSLRQTGLKPVNKNNVNKNINETRWNMNVESQKRH